MATQIDFRTLPANVPVLCIPRVFANIGEARIRRIFDDLNMGQIEKIDIIGNRQGGEKGEKFNRVFVHFKRWNDSENSCVARERLLNGKEIKVIYDDPWFWKIVAYRESEPKQTISKQQSKKAVLQLEYNDLPTPDCFKTTEAQNRIMKGLSNGLTAQRRPRAPRFCPRESRNTNLKKKETREATQVVIPDSSSREVEDK